MAEINLLKTPGSDHSIWENASGWVVKILVVLALGVIGYYGYLFLKVKSTEKQIVEVTDSIVRSKTEALNMPGREEFMVRQAQAKEFTALSGSHVYFSKFLPALAKVTYKSAYYNNVNLTVQGKITMQVVVPTLAEVDKFLQVFDDPEISKNFFNVRLGGFTQVQDQTGPAYLFTIQMDYNPGILTAK